MVFLFWIWAYLIGLTLGNPDAKRLYDDLLSNYNRLIRPVSNHTEKVTVKLGMRLSQLLELNLKDQILSTNVWMEHEWRDYKFKWDPEEYGGVTEIYVPSEHIWLPDIILYNNADGDYIVTTMTKAILHYDGRVVWTPPAIFKSSCEINVEFFPFDEQECFLKFGSWTFDGFQVDLVHINADPNNSTVAYGMDLSEYYPNVEWDILSVPAQRHVKTYPCCPEPFPDIYFSIIIRRKPLFYTVNLIIPCVGIFYLSILVFYLPAQSGEKTALVIAILVSQTLYFNLVIEVIPATSVTLPLLGRYLMFSTILIAIAIALTSVILNLHYRKPSTHKMPSWVRRVFIQKLPALLLMRVPIQVIKDSMRAKKSKFLRNSDPNQRFVEGEEQDEPATVKINSDSNLSRRQEGMDDQLKGHLNGIYHNFCKIMSKTKKHGHKINEHEILGPVAPDSPMEEGPSLFKSPFVVEKAIHNIMFIKHHMQRQDEFDAEDQDWGIVAMVLDRLFLWVFGTIALIGSGMILTASPFIFEDIKPIDILYSKIAQEESRLFDEKIFV